jgi:hypothetical protein
MKPSCIIEGLMIFPFSILYNNYQKKRKEKLKQKRNQTTALFIIFQKKFTFPTSDLAFWFMQYPSAYCSIIYLVNKWRKIAISVQATPHYSTGGMQHCKLLKTYQHSNIGAKRTQFQ